LRISDLAAVNSAYARVERLATLARHDFRHPAATEYTIALATKRNLVTTRR
jgi:hypothetical protein